MYKIILFFFLAFTSVLIANEPYTVQILHSPSEKITEELERISQLFILKERAPATLIGLRRRADNDLPDLIKVLHSQGYYAAEASISLDSQEKPTKVSIDLKPGKIFILEEVNWTGADARSCEALEAIPLATLPFPYKEKALPSEIIKAEKKILELLADEGFPFASISKREALADNAQGTVSLSYTLSSGPKVTFGETTLIGNKKVKEVLIRKKIAWKKGAVFSKSVIQKTENRLESLALFVTVDISYPDEPLEDGSLPMTIEVSEGKMRTVGAGISYMNDPGFKTSAIWERFGVNGTWQHRNIRGLGEKVSVQTTLGREYYYGTVQYLQPEFLGLRKILSGWQRRPKIQPAVLRSLFSPSQRYWIEKSADRSASPMD